MDTLPSNNQSFMDLPPVESSPNMAPSEKVEAPQTPAQVGTERNPELLPPQSSQQLGQIPQGSVPTDPATIAIPTSTAPAQTSAVSTTPVSPMPQMADDIDLIEKEWVEKAKDIVNKTKDDPHTQNKELNKVKAEYIKQRFQKDVYNSQESSS